MQSMIDRIEQFVADFGKDVEQAIDGWVDASEEWLEQVETAIAPDLEQRLSEFFDPLLEAYLGFEVAMEESVRETVQPVVNTVEPMMNDHPTCVGCRNYHGQSYNGVMLVCGMHPSGWDGEQCPDWESFWQNPTH